ncbi:hypothetical protein JOL79_11670 [Microbispora sp. RL4-1S]|uniref:Uncharacterized protein n=1 Tax=Microbispora oryzae TaxID=2806554 RepID=A0A941AJR8_9ACTN|nr:hypothetical protein [Microbispora oryzae]MBP2704473.1 hypothetical protein [Microbispora oryzae]
MADTPVFQPNERVRVTVDVAVHHASDGVLHGTYGTQQNLNEQLLSIVVTEPGVTVQRLAPADGEPRPGQIWADRHNTEWYASMSGSRDVWLNCWDGRSQHWRNVHTGPTGPITLVRDVPPQADGPLKGDWTYQEDGTTRAVDPSGQVWDLGRHVTDANGDRWHWAGGFTTETPDESYQPLMTRDDWSRQDVPIGLIAWPVTACGPDCPCGKGVESRG